MWPEADDPNSDDLNPDERRERARILGEPEEAVWDDLVHQFDTTVYAYYVDKLAMGRILRLMKLHIQKYGKTVKGCRGRWKPLLDHYGLHISTVRDLIRNYERAEKIPKAQCAFKPLPPKPPKQPMSVIGRKKSHKTGKTNTPESGSLGLSNQPDAAGRELVEAVFVLTEKQKQQFMIGVRKLGDRATAVIYEAVITAANLKTQSVGE